MNNNSQGGKDMEVVKSVHRSIMNMFFTHTYLEKRRWRGWFKNGQSLGISLGTCWDFGINYTYLSDENEHLRSRYLFLYFYKLIITIPLGLKVIHEVKEINDKLCKLYQERNTIKRLNRNLSDNELKHIEELSKIEDEIEPLRKESHNLYKKYENYKLPEYELRISKEHDIILHFYKWEKTILLPFRWYLIESEIYLKDGTWISSKKIDEYDDPDDLVYRESHPYKYTLENGKIQERIATITSKRSHLTYNIFKPKWFRRFKFLNWIKQSIDVSFNDEVGEITNSWKGGTIGCSYTLLPNESMQQCLRRMELNRKFE